MSDVHSTWKQRILGIAFVAVIYAGQAFVFHLIRSTLQQSVSAAIMIPISIGIGWLLSGLVLGGMVINRSLGIWRFGIGLACSLLLTILFVVAGLNYLRSLPPSYSGP